MREMLFAIAWKAMPWILAVLVFVCMVLLTVVWHPKRKVIQAYEEFTGLLAERTSRLAWYQRCELFLIRNGASFHFGKWITPGSYLLLELLAGLGGLLVGASFEIIYGILAFVLLSSLPGVLLRHLNSRDNEAMLPELKLLYHALEIQLRAGIYVTDALAECYGCVQQERLKQALLDLAGDIVLQSDIYKALADFQGKFDNRHVDSLCITLLQALESGQAVELLNDLSEQIKDMELSVVNRKKGALDRSITFYQLGILSAVLGIVLYACVTQLFSANLFF